MVLPEGLVHPHKPAIATNAQAEQGIAEIAVFIIIAPRLFRRAGIMNITQNGDLITPGHVPSSAKTAATQLTFSNLLPECGRPRPQQLAPAYRPRTTPQTHPALPL